MRGTPVRWWSQEGAGLLTSEAPLYRGTSLTKQRTPLGPYRRLMPRVLRGSEGGGRFLMGEVPLNAGDDIEDPVLLERVRARARLGINKIKV